MPLLTTSERLGTLVGARYRLDQVVGRGGMGVVFASLDTATSRPVAVKILHGDIDEELHIRRFFREAKFAARLAHPNMVDVTETGTTEDGAPFLVLELLRGESFGSRLKRGTLHVSEALAVTMPIMDALRAAHDVGVLHRDVKPENIFLAVEGSGDLVPKLLDFGVSKLSAPDPNSLATATGQMVGTPAYMSPEQVESTQAVDGRTDVWSIGVVLFEALTGRRPFQADSMLGLLVEIMRSPVPTVAESAPWVPGPIASEIDRALSKTRDSRPTMQAFWEALAAAARQAGVPVPPRPAPR
ncbi:MAG: serine/threonine-protein kinase [Sandaracinaceae bacterium]